MRTTSAAPARLRAAPHRHGPQPPPDPAPHRSRSGPARRRWAAVALAIAALAAGAACRRPPPVDRPVPAPTVTGPVTGGRLGIPFTSMPEGMADENGYTEEEYFLSGTALAYRAGSLPADGRWTLRSDATAPYTTRIVVRRPADPARFSGTVVVEWFNVSGGIDVDADFGFLHPEIFRSGDAYVGVSAQKIGVDGGMPLLGSASTPLKTWDPQRYAPLNHPGDRWSYDIFSQVGRALREPGATDPLRGLRPGKIIAAGESQSAGRLISYINGVHPLARVYDGYLVHSRFSRGAGFDPTSGLSMPATRVRPDLGVPVLQFTTETDLVGLDFRSAREPDTDQLRTWEVAGTAHADRALQDYQLTAVRRTRPDIEEGTGSVNCPTMNDGPQQYVLRRGYADLRAWVEGGPAPARGEPIALTGTTIERDEHGNARGGIRTPALDVPVATLSGEAGEGGGGFCFLFGSTVPFDAAKLRQLYPNHDEYVSRVTASADRTVSAGFITGYDAEAIVDAAREAPIPPPA